MFVIRGSTGHWYMYMINFQSCSKVEYKKHIKEILKVFEIG